MKISLKAWHTAAKATGKLLTHAAHECHQQSVPSHQTGRCQLRCLQRSVVHVWSLRECKSHRWGWDSAGFPARQQLLPCFFSQDSFATVLNESHQVFQQHAVSNRLHHMLNVYIRTACWCLHCSELLRLLAEALRIWFCWAIYSVIRSAQRSCVKQQWTGTVLWGNNDCLHYFIHRHTTAKTCHSISESSIPFCTHRLQIVQSNSLLKIQSQ